MDADSTISPAMNRTELASKVEWEGGAFEALRTGIRSRHIDDDDVAALWRQMEALYEQMGPVAWKIDRLLKAA